MSACLDTLLADCRTGPESRAPEPNHVFVLTDDQCDEMDDTAGILDEMRNTLVRAEFIARQRRFDSQFGVLA